LAGLGDAADVFDGVLAEIGGEEEPYDGSDGAAFD
jgi:hypothetical protein